MKWSNANLDSTPKHLQVVLVSVEGVYYITIYDAHENLYRLKEEPQSYFSPDKTLLYWTEFSDPRVNEDIFE